MLLPEKIVLFAKRRPIIFCLLCLLLLYGGNVARYLIWPPMWNLDNENPAVTSFMEYRQAQWLAEDKNIKVSWTWRSLSRISPNLRRAVIVAEDSTFWEHHGFDWQGIRVAIDKNIDRGRLSAGGSTITQQLAKNLLLSGERNLLRKGQELALAFLLEQFLDKRRILELYLNHAEWGQGIFGAEAAAQHYFKKPASRLTSLEAARLAVMLPRPRYFQQHWQSGYLSQRAQVIARRMAGTAIP